MYIIESSFLKNSIKFDWDAGNIDKNLRKHNVTDSEIEEIFANKGVIINPNFTYSGLEPRYQIFGLNSRNEERTVIFTIRGDKIRVISARHLNKKEQLNYEAAKKNTKI